MWFLIAGASFMLHAVLHDPYARTRYSSAVFLLGTALWIIGCAQVVPDA